MHLWQADLRVVDHVGDGAGLIWATGVLIELSGNQVIEPKLRLWGRIKVVVPTVEVWTVEAMGMESGIARCRPRISCLVGLGHLGQGLPGSGLSRNLVSALLKGRF